MLCYCSVAETDPALQCYNAKENSNLCQECFSKARYNLHSCTHLFLDFQCTLALLQQYHFGSCCAVFLWYAVTVNVGRAGAASLDVIQEVEYVKQEAKVVYLLECLQKTPPPVSTVMGLQALCRIHAVHSKVF